MDQWFDKHSIGTLDEGWGVENVILRTRYLSDSVQELIVVILWEKVRWTLP